MKKYTASIEQAKPQSPVMDFVMCLLHSVTNAHILHLSTTSYAAHKALENYYEEIGGIVDSFIEAYQGKYGLLTGYNSDYMVPADPISYMAYLSDEVAKLRRKSGFPQDSELQNITDEIVQLIDSTSYKLKFLK